MVNKAQIQKNLIQINTYFQKSMGDKKALYFSKLALLEACGWIEESIDNVILVCANTQLAETKNRELVEKVVKDTHSFEYDRHFRNLLIQVFGIINVEKIESNIDQVKFELMKSSLGTLKKYRDTHAHTYTKGVTKTVYAPSTTMSHFQKVYEGLKEIEKCIRKIKAISY